MRTFQITVEATIPGGKQLHGAKVRSTDLRAGAAMVLAISSNGTTGSERRYIISKEDMKIL